MHIESIEIYPTFESVYYGSDFVEAWPWTVRVGMYRGDASILNSFLISKPLVNWCNQSVGSAGWTTGSFKQFRTGHDKRDFCFTTHDDALAFYMAWSSRLQDV